MSIGIPDPRSWQITRNHPDLQKKSPHENNSHFFRTSMIMNSRHKPALLIIDQDRGRAYITMNESVQTSVEQINLLAAQLRYKIDCALQQSSSTQQRYLQVSAEDIDVDEYKGRETNAEIRPSSNDAMSSATSLEIDYLNREILDLKQIIEKLSNQLRLKDSALKNVRDELKQEKSCAEITLRDHRQIVAEAKSNERYVKCVQTEYELLQSMTAKSQEAFLAMSNESLKHAVEFDKTAKMVQKQMKEIMGKNVEIRNLQEDLMRLHTDVTNQRAAAGLNSSSLKFLQLEVERLTEREMRLDARISSLTERIERERHINAMLNQTVEETESKANKAVEGIQLASNQQSELLIRLSKVNSEILALKVTLQEQQSLAQSNVNRKCKIDEIDEDSNKNSANCKNDSVDDDVDNAIDSNVSINNDTMEKNVLKLDVGSNLKNEIITSNIDSNKNRFISSLDDNFTQMHDQHPAEDKQDDMTAFNRNDSRVREINVKMSDSEHREEERDVTTITPSFPRVGGTSTDIEGRVEESKHMNDGLFKKQRIESRREDTVSQDGRVTPREFQSVTNMRKIRQENKDNYKNKDEVGNGMISKPDFSSDCVLNSPLVLQAQAARNDKESLQPNGVAFPIKPQQVGKGAFNIEDLELDDENCQICQDHPFGLMMLCTICKRALHSACAKKVGLGLFPGKDFKCPQC